METPPSLPPLEELILRIIDGQPPEQAIAAMNLSAAAGAKLITQARKRITLAADYQRDEQLGLAIARLNDLYAKLAEAGKPEGCLKVQKELNRLMDLYRTVTAEAGNSTGNEDLAAVREYLEPLALAAPNTAVPELARLAAARLIDADRYLRN
ncbi:MAG TPA: hypothetical protein VHY37_07335 [Tepidisphaeraceae bacterium]|jgi:hypothetical protein|nr:hypothetical protein [Tepidisphaeraceae bacterium]